MRILFLLPIFIFCSSLTIASSDREEKEVGLGAPVSIAGTEETVSDIQRQMTTSEQDRMLQLMLAASRGKPIEWRLEAELARMPQGTSAEERLNACLALALGKVNRGIPSQFIFESVLRLTVIPFSDPLHITLSVPDYWAGPFFYDGPLMPGYKNASHKDPNWSMITGVKWEVISAGIVIGTGTIPFVHYTSKTLTAETIGIGQFFAVGAVVRPHQNFLSLNQAFTYVLCSGSADDKKIMAVLGEATRTTAGVPVLRTELEPPASYVYKEGGYHNLYDRLRECVITHEDVQYTPYLMNNTPTVSNGGQEFPIQLRPYGGMQPIWQASAVPAPSVLDGIQCLLDPPEEEDELAIFSQRIGLASDPDMAFWEQRSVLRQMLFSAGNASEALAYANAFLTGGARGVAYGSRLGPWGALVGGIVCATGSVKICHETMNVVGALLAPKIEGAHKYLNHEYGPEVAEAFVLSLEGAAVINGFQILKSARRVVSDAKMTWRLPQHPQLAMATAEGQMARHLPEAENTLLRNVESSTGGRRPHPEGSLGTPKIREDKASHIFRDKAGHFRKDTPENRAMIEKVSGKPENYLGRDLKGQDWYAEVMDGKQIWVECRGETVRNAGVNDIHMHRPWSIKTGLKSE